MKKTIPAVLVVVFLGFASAKLYQRFFALNTSTKVANRLVKLINAADYSGAENLFNKEMSQALPLDQATGLFKGLTRHMGKIQRMDEPKPNREWTVYPVHGERGML